jgi:hypothetical protein
MIKAMFLLSIFCVANAFAIPIDPVPDHIGVYFDSDATITDFDSTPNVPFTAYVIITNPTAANLWGAELSYQFVVPPGFENSVVRPGNSLPPESVDLGNSENPTQGDYVVGLATPLPQSTAVIFVTWDLVLTDEFPMDILLGPALAQSIEDDLPAYAAGDSIVALGSSSGNFSISVATVNGGVSDVPRDELRNPVVLEQCRPNPFNPRTTIKYSVAREGRVTLLIHDISGRAVRVLLDGAVVRPGGHEVVWDGLDNAGTEVASGVYFYRLEAMGISETKRMTLVR